MKKKLFIVLVILISVIFLSCENPLFVKITNLYNVDFITNGGSEVASMRTSEITQNPITEKQDAVFEGWYTTSTFVGTAIVIPYEVTENICLYAKWKEKYTVYFETNCNQQIQSYKTFIVDSIPVIERDGYYFDGWYTNQNFTGEKVSFPYSLSQNTTFYAKWIQEHNVSFESNGGTKFDSIKTHELTSLPQPIKDDCVFNGWHLTPDFSDSAITVPYQVTKPITLYANYKQKYTVSFNTNGGSEIDSIRAVVIPESPNTTLQNHYFVGWYEKPELTGLKVEFPYSVTKDITLNAKWQPTYAVNFETNGGTSIPSFRTIELTELSEPTKTKHTFAGWYTDSELTKKLTLPLVLDDDITLYAKWIENYTVIFDSQGGSEIPSVTSAYIESEPISTKADKTFMGWYTVPECNDEYKVEFPYTVTSDVILYAKWVAQMWTITYNSNGATSGTVPEQIFVEKGKSFTVSANTGKLTKPGYAFTKWSTSSDGQSGSSYSVGQTVFPSKNLTLYAQWGKDYAEMVDVAGGTFYFGDNTSDGTTDVKVTLDSFRIAKYELTYELWLEVYTWAKENGYVLLSAKKGYAENDKYKSFVPATNISWKDACVWLNAYSEYKGFEPVYYIGNSVFRDVNLSTKPTWNRTKNGFRLPTECEWEYAAKGGPEQKNYMYAGSNVLDDVAWYYWGYSNSNGEAQPVGTKKANTLGLYDMTGLSCELCFDNITLASGDYVNPIASTGVSYRGGTCYYNYRSSGYPYENNNYVYQDNKKYDYYEPALYEVSTIRVAQNAQ